MEDIYTLIQRAQKGDEEAKENIITENSGLVWSVVRRFHGRGEQEDLYQIGVIGLLKCIEKFDFTYDVKFSTYAVPMIMGEIKRFLRDDGMIKVSRNLKELAYRARLVQETVLKEDNREISITELADRLSVNKEELILALESAKEVQSIFDSHEKNSGTALLIDQISDYTENEKMLEKLSLKEAMRHLSTKERQIIFLRYYRDKTQSEVAKQIGISQVQVSRLEKKILKQMKASLQ